MVNSVGDMSTPPLGQATDKSIKPMYHLVYYFIIIVYCVPRPSAALHSFALQHNLALVRRLGLEVAAAVEDDGGGHGLPLTLHDRQRRRRVSLATNSHRLNIDLNID